MSKFYKLIGTGDMNDILKTTLMNRGVHELDIYDIINPLESSFEIPFSKLYNMDKAIKLFNSILVENKITNDELIVIVTDSDADGWTSSAILENYLNKNFTINVEHIMHSKRANGLTAEIMTRIEQMEKLPSLVILPDASSNDFEQHKILHDLGIKVLVLDHHIVELDKDNKPKESKFATVVNPQLSPEYTNKQISGVGVTYKFLQALDEYYNLFSANDDLDLVAVGNITDSMSMKSLETRSIVYKGLLNIQNEFILELIRRNLSFSETPSPYTLGWKVLPKLNAVIRFGSIEEKEFVYGALLGLTGEFYNPKARSEKTRNENYAQKAARLCTNVTSKQKRERDKLLKGYMDIIKEKGIIDNPLLVVTSDEPSKSGLTGYTANNIVNNLKRPVVLVHWNEKQQMYRGSLRGYNKVLEDTNEFLTNSGLCEFVAGHNQAAGVGIKKENIEALNEYIKENLSLNSSVNEVDFILSSEELTNNIFDELEELKQYWGKDLDEPKFCIKNIKIKKTDIITQNTTKFFTDGKEYISFTPMVEFDSIPDNHEIVMNIVGSVGINNFFGESTNQVRIDEVEIVSTRELDFLESFMF